MQNYFGKLYKIIVLQNKKQVHKNSTSTTRKQPYKKVIKRKDPKERSDMIYYSYICT